MQFSDLLVIYLALGAPLAVYTVSVGHEQRMLSLAKGAFSGLFWPVPGIARLISGRSSDYSDTRSTRHRVDDLFSVPPPAEALFDLREAVERYSGLFRASFEIGTAAIDGLAQIDAVAAPHAAKAVARRKNRTRIERHLSQARLDLLAELDRLTDDPHTSTRYALDLAAEVGDTEMEPIIASRPSYVHSQIRHAA